MKQQEYRLGYRADLEGLRAIAILLVVAVHAGVPWLPGGFIGVDVFFVLSGFLITGLLVQETTTTGGLRFARFYVRRLRRLLPALFIMLATVGLLAALLLAPGEQRGQASAASMAAVWLSNFHFAFAHVDYFAPGTETNLFLHTWSLGVEEQFYLIWPALLVWLLGRDHQRGLARLKVGMWVVVVASLAACVWLSYRAPELAFYMMPLRAWQFAAGALIWLYFMVPGRHKTVLSRSRSSRTLLGWLGIGLILFAGTWLHGAMTYPGAYALLPTAGAVAVIVSGCVSTPSVGVTRLLSWRPMQWIGHVSYSWYLWHWPILLLGAALVGSDAPAYRVLWVLVSLGLACASYGLIESPIRRQRFWLTRSRMTIFGALACMVLANSLCLSWAAHASIEMHSPKYRRFMAAHADAPVIYAMGCDDWYHSARVHACAFGPATADHTAVLIGDSHAGQWFPAVAEVFDRPDWRLLVLTKSSCPMVDEPFFYKRIAREYTVCSVWRAHALAYVARLRPDVVLMTSDVVSFTKAQWIKGTAKVLDVLSPASGHVYLIRDTPSLPFDGPGCLAEHAGRPAWLDPRQACAASVHMPHAALVYQWLRMAAAPFSNVSTIDMNASICPGGVCAAARDGVVVFRDSQHLTRRFAATLGPALAHRLGMHLVKGPGRGSTGHRARF